MESGTSAFSSSLQQCRALQTKTDDSSLHRVLRVLCSECEQKDWCAQSVGVTTRRLRLVHSILYKNEDLSKEVMISLFDKNDETLFMCIKNPINVSTPPPSPLKILSHVTETGFSFFSFSLAEIMFLHSHVSSPSIFHSQLSSPPLLSLLTDLANDCVTNGTDVTIPIQVAIIVLTASLSHAQIQKEIGDSQNLAELLHFLFLSQLLDSDVAVRSLLHNTSYLPFVFLCSIH